jgi:acyl carrier protein
MSGTCVAPSTSVDPHAAIRDRLLDILHTNLPPDALPATLDDSTGLLGHGIGLDSIEVLALVCAIEEAFDLTVADDCLQRTYFETIGSLVAFIQERLAS